MERVLSRVRRTGAVLLSLLLAMSIFPAGLISHGAGGPIVGVAYAEEYDAEGVEITQEGVTYTCDFLSNGTVEIQSISADDSVTTVNVPSAIEKDGKAYTVTAVEFRYGTKGDNVEQLNPPDTIQDLGGNYFRKFAKIKELTIPGSIKNFDLSLQNSGNLEKLVFSEGVEELSSNMMVYGCGKLKEIDLPSTLKLISQSGAFSGATALESINLPDGLAFAEDIGSVFSDCSALTSIVLPESITKIPSGTFNGCTSLASVTAKGEISAIGNSAFQECKSLTQLALPGQLTSIGYSAFQDCENLSSVPDLSAVTSLGSYAFYNCQHLNCGVDLSSLSEIPDYAFCYSPVTVEKFSSNLKSIGKWSLIWATVADDLPETLEKIGPYAFYACDLPETFAIPNSVTSVGDGAFGSTAGVKEITIGSGLTSISSALFDDSSVEKIVIDNSADDITGAENLPGAGVEIVYLVESIDDAVGDTISNAAGTKTLQEAVNEAPDGVATTISIQKHVKLGSTLSIPAGKNIKIACDEPYTVLATSGMRGNLVDIAEGATLELAGKVKLRGRYNTGSIINSAGALVFSDSATVFDGTVSSTASGAVKLSGPAASLTMNGGVIEKCTVNEVYCGTVFAANGAHVALQGGSVRGNRVASADGDGNYLSSAGIMLLGNAHLEMTSGSIADNNGYQGSAVMMYAPDSAQDARATFLMAGGEIKDNASSKLGKRTPSGAVHVEGNAAFTMTGGAISGNSAAGGGKGGGVCVVDPGIQGNGAPMNTAFTMKAADEAGARSAATAGTISGNTASAGGGIYSYSDSVALSAGTIEGNTAWNMGGGIYSEGNNDHYSTLHIQNACVTQNTASKQGGGMWFCPTGDAKVYVQDGGLIAKNTAEGAGDDVVFTGLEGDPFTLTLANRAPGGGKVLWYRDGGLFPPAGMAATVNPEVPRFVEGGNNGDPLTFQEARANVALKSTLTEDAFTLGAAQTTLTISNNQAALGGGIGANGGIVIGKDEKRQIPVEKIWDHGTNPESSRPAAVTVNLKNGETTIDSMTLTADCDWKGVFTELPAGGNYSVEEVAVPQYTTEISGDANDGFVVKNTFVPADPEPGVPPAPEPGTPSSPEPGTSEGDQRSTGDSNENGSQLARTGDSANIYLWLALATVSALAICGTCALSRAGRSRETRGAARD